MNSEAAKKLRERDSEKKDGLMDDFMQEMMEEGNESQSQAAQFMSSILDLTVDLAPPKSLYIEVRVNGDYGTVMLPESGEVTLLKNSTHLLRRTDVDHLIKRGMLSEII